MAELWRRLGLGPREAAVLLVYSVMVGFAVAHYQQSLDEGREWLVARTFSLPHIFFHVLHYEGHPALLYTLLWLPAHLHMPYPWINVLSALVGVGAAYVLLRLSPFPFYLRALLPFCFALGYQEVVVARSYALFPLLGFLAAHQYRARPTRPVMMAVALALLANLSFHGTLVAMGLGIAYALHLRVRSPSQTWSGDTPKPALRLGMAITIFIASLIFAAACIYPEKYNAMTPSQALSRVLHRAQGPQAIAPAERANPGPPASPVTSSSSPATSIPAVQDRQRQLDLLRLVFVYPASSFAPLSVGFQLLLLWFLCSRGQWALILPIAFLDYFLLFGYVAYRHTPLVWVTYLVVLWAAWDANPAGHENATTGSFQSQPIVAWALALLCALQVPWTISAIRYELHHATYPAKETAAYLATLAQGTRIDGDKSAYAIMPYRPGYLPVDRANGKFADHASMATSSTIDPFLTGSADVLLLNETLGSPAAAARLHDAGYTEVRVFCGGPYFPNIPIALTCFHVFARRSSAPVL